MNKKIILLTLLGLGACGDRVGKLNSIERAEEMQKDLETRRLFFSALEGTYEGIFSNGDTESNLRIVLTQTLPDYGVDRIKTLQELEYEFQNMAFHVQITSWSSSRSAFGCTVENVKPDIKNGVIRVVSNDCPNSYHLFVKDRLQAAEASSRILSGDSRDIQELDGVVYSKNLSTKMSAFVQKVSE